MKIRMQRGGLEESMATVREIEPNVRAVFDYLGEMGISFRTPISLGVVPYGRDERIGWDTFLVSLEGQALAYTNGPFEIPSQVPATEYTAEQAAAPLLDLPAWMLRGPT